MLVIVLGDSKTESTSMGTQHFSKKLVLSRGTPYGGPGFGCFSCPPPHANFFLESGVSSVSNTDAENSFSFYQ